MSDEEYEEVGTIVPDQTSYYTPKASFYGKKVERRDSEKDSDYLEDFEEPSASRARKKWEIEEEEEEVVPEEPPKANPKCYADHRDWADNSENAKEPELVEIVTREAWGAAEPLSEHPVEGPPLSKVLLFYTGEDPCFNKEECCKVVRDLQEKFMTERKLADIPWNFLIGTDGRVYEGRGWGFHAKKVNSLYKFRKHEFQSYDIAYIGPYFKERKEELDERTVWPKLSFLRPMYHALRILITTGVKSNFVNDSFGLESQVGC